MTVGGIALGAGLMYLRSKNLDKVAFLSRRKADACEENAEKIIIDYGNRKIASPKIIVGDFNHEKSEDAESKNEAKVIVGNFSPNSKSEDTDEISYEEDDFIENPRFTYEELHTFYGGDTWRLNKDIEMLND